MTLCFLWALAALPLFVAQANAQASIKAFSGVIEGHEVGGVSIDMVGDVYAADFGDLVWRITPEGKRRAFATGLYGASGNAIDNQGRLLQANFYADTLTRIDRDGVARSFVTQGLNRPTGVAVDRRTGRIFVANCRANTVVEVTAEGAVKPFAASPLFNCPYGMAFDRAGVLYAVNYDDNRMLKIEPSGAVSPFATVSDKGLGYLCFKGDRFYVTAFRTHQIYEVTLDATVRQVLGNSERGHVDGDGSEARLSFPAGIACHPWAPRIYVNEDLNASSAVLPRRSAIRVITLPSTN